MEWVKHTVFIVELWQLGKCDHAHFMSHTWRFNHCINICRSPSMIKVSTDHMTDTWRWHNHYIHGSLYSDWRTAHASTCLSTLRSLHMHSSPGHTLNAQITSYGGGPTSGMQSKLKLHGLMARWRPRFGIQASNQPLPFNIQLSPKHWVSYWTANAELAMEMYSKSKSSPTFGFSHQELQKTSSP